LFRHFETRTEARRLRHAFSLLTQRSLNLARNSEQPTIARNIDHCRALLARGIDGEPNRRLIETLLRYMEGTIAEDSGSSVPPSFHNPGPTARQSDEKRLKIVARELLKGQGLRTISYLRELADIAHGAGDPSSAAAWHELADAAERITYLLSRGANRGRKTGEARVEPRDEQKSCRAAQT
jgi:hypothetical protein